LVVCSPRAGAECAQAGSKTCELGFWPVRGEGQDLCCRIDDRLGPGREPGPDRIPLPPRSSIFPDVDVTPIDLSLGAPLDVYNRLRELLPVVATVISGCLSKDAVKPPGKGNEVTEGNVVMRVVSDDQGRRVAASVVRDDLDDRQVESCAAAALEALPVERLGLLGKSFTVNFRVRVRWGEAPRSRGEEGP
jgi:hypothetical protein